MKQVGLILLAIFLGVALYLGMLSASGKQEENLPVPFSPPQGERPEPPFGDKPVPTDREQGRIFESLSADFGTPDFTLTSTAVEEGELLDEFKCEEKVNGKEKSIPLRWRNVPPDTASLAIVMYHYPHGEDRTTINSYLLLWGIDPSVSEIPYGEADDGPWYMGRNKDGNAISYTSPCSQGPGSHEYIIAIFALSSYPEDLPKLSTAGVDVNTFMDAVEKAGIIGRGDLKFLSK